MTEDPAAGTWNAGAGHYFTDEASNSRPILYDNGVFTWPKTFVRTPVGVQHVRRGYMRALTEAGEQHAAVGAGATDTPPPAATSTPAGAGRLHFQFNPQRIQRSVEGRSDVHTWLNLDPYQMTQPIAGQAAFGLELIFNREADVAATPTSMKTAAIEDLTSPTAVLSRYAGQIGVLADIYVLDAIIGQGVNSMSLQNIINRARYLAEHAPVEGTTTAGSTDEQTGGLVPPAPFVWDATAEEELKSRMEGNAAYLIPQPVRIVLSDLFMIDGLVQGSEVIFQKFSSLMIPTLCSVTLTIEAMYFGFRRKDTVLTQLWNKPFQRQVAVSQGGGMDQTTTAVDGTTSIGAGAVTNPDAVTAAVVEKMKNGGLFHKVAHHEETKFAEFDAVPNTNPARVTEKFNLRWFAGENSGFIKDNGLEIKSGVLVDYFRYKHSSGAYVDASVLGSKPVVEPVLAPTKKDSSRWVTAGAGGDHKIVLTPKPEVLRQVDKKLSTSAEYEMRLKLWYEVKSGGSPWIRSRTYLVTVRKRGSDNWNISDVELNG